MPASKNTFYLLEPLEVLQHPEQWLGRIVKDYRRPRDGAVPRTPATYVEGVDDDHFTNVDALISQTKSTAFGANLVQLLGSKYEHSHKNGRGVKAREVHRIRLQDPEEVLAKLQRDTAVNTHLEEWLSLKPFSPPVYFIVGFLVAQDPELSTEAEHSQTVGGNVDPLGIAAAATGVPMPVEGVEGEVEHTHSNEAHISATAPGTRIFAMEYKILRKRLHSSAIRNEGYGPQGTATFSGDLRITPQTETIETIEVGPEGKTEQTEAVVFLEPPLEETKVEQRPMLEDFEWLGDSRFGLAKVQDTSFVFTSDVQGGQDQSKAEMY
ncbi:MAG: hypothetical protein M4579_003757 [Chaenotheca gracillima]|nr:MAG: hypothetical protein M4579_003757 [Chaenotheca gracillima]